jgi:hypothetical protein
MVCGGPALGWAPGALQISADVGMSALSEIASDGHSAANQMARVAIQRRAG